MNDDELADCADAAARFAERHDPESPLFARDLRMVAARIRELSTENERLRAAITDHKTTQMTEDGYHAMSWDVKLWAALGEES